MAYLSADDKKVFLDVVNSGENYGKIANTLNEKKILTHTGRSWTTGAVSFQAIKYGVRKRSHVKKVSDAKREKLSVALKQAWALRRQANAPTVDGIEIARELVAAKGLSAETVKYLLKLVL